MCLSACVYIVWAQLGELEALCAWRAAKCLLLVAATCFFFQKPVIIVKGAFSASMYVFARPKLLASADFLWNEINGLLPFRPY